MWARNGRWILPEMPDFHVAFRNLLHAVNLRHGTDGFTSPPKEGVLRIFSPWKIRRLRPDLNPRPWVPKASTLPLDHRSHLVLICTGSLSYIIHFISCLRPFHVLVGSPTIATVPFSCYSRGTCTIVQMAVNIGLFINTFNWNFYLNILQLILGFYSPYLKKLLEMVSFGLQIFVPSKQRVIAHERCAGETEDECFLF